ncbi:unnamed protein product [Gordionus sp. m RMFG-2023]
MTTDKVLSTIFPIKNILELDNGQNHKKIFVILYIIQIVLILLINFTYFWTQWDKYILNWFHILLIHLRKSSNIGSLHRTKTSNEITDNKNKILIVAKRHFASSVRYCFWLRAFADIMFALICMPTQIHIGFYSQFNRKYNTSFDYVMCTEVTILWYFKGVFVNLSSFSILAIAIDRFWVIVMPLKYKSDKKHIKCSILILILAVFFLPIFFLIVKIFNATSFTQYCRLSSWNLRANSIWLMTSGIIFPYTVSILLYCYISHFLKSSKRCLMHTPTSNSDTDKAILVVYLLIGVYSVCYIPILVFSFMAILTNLDFHSEKVQLTLHGLSIWFSSVRWINPLLLMALNSSLRFETTRDQFYRFSQIYMRNTSSKKVEMSTYRIIMLEEKKEEN